MSVLNEEESWFFFHISEEFRVLRSVIWHKMLTTKDGDNEDDDILRWQYRLRCIAVTYHALLCSTILNTYNSSAVQCIANYAKAG